MTVTAYISNTRTVETFILNLSESVIGTGRVTGTRRDYAGRRVDTIVATIDGNQYAGEYMPNWSQMIQLTPIA